MGWFPTRRQPDPSRPGPLQWLPDTERIPWLMEDEHRRWVAAGGSEMAVRDHTRDLPDGWVELVRTPGPAGGVVICGNRAGGDWFLWETYPDWSRKPKYEAFFGRLYDRCMSETELRALLAMVVLFYDQSDPVEAAEATIVALGGEPRFWPRNLVEARR